jgi:hypothetical protein
VPATTKYLPIYLNDHLAGATAALELAKRAASENEGSVLGDFLSALSREIEADKRSLEEIMRVLGASIDHTKVAAGWLGEKAGRLKLNGHLFSLSPLSPLVELEVLALGIEGKLGLWLALAETVASELPLATLEELIARAELQREEIEPYRLAAAAVALAG